MAYSRWTWDVVDVDGRQFIRIKDNSNNETWRVDNSDGNALHLLRQLITYDTAAKDLKWVGSA